MEVRLRLPGKSDVGGLWPAFWLMGNLGRATYEHSTNMMWPWSFNKCDRDKQEAQVGACIDLFLFVYLFIYLIVHLLFIYLLFI